MGKAERQYGGSKDPDSHGAEEHQPLLEASTGLYVANNRPYNDVFWTFAWLSLLVLASVGGVAAFMHRNVAFAELVTVDHLNDPASCPLPSPERSLLADLDYRGNPFQVDPFIGRVALWIGVAIGLPFLLGTAFVLLVRHHAGALVTIAIALQIALPAAAAGASFGMGQMPTGAMMLFLTGLTALTFMLWRDQIHLVTKLLGVAGRGLVDNVGLIGATFGIQAGLAIVSVPLALSMFAGLMNGKVVYNTARVPGDVDQCIDVDGQAVMCCAWQVDSWVRPFLAAAAVAQLWTVMLASEVRTFTVSGAVAAWYFEPVAGSSFRQQAAPSRTLRSLRHALGPNFGSLCLGSAVLTLTQLARQALESLRRNAEDNFLAGILLAVFNLFLGLVDYATKFATVRVAITGEAFFKAGKGVVDLLVRNFMDAFGVWWLPPMILQSCAFVVSLVMSVAMYFTARWTWGPTPEDEQQASAAQTAQYALAFVAFLASWVVLAFFCSLLLNIIDAVFVCFAMDRDAQACTHMEVHEVYSQLPSVKQGEVVENPGGGLQYGAPTGVGA